VTWALSGNTSICYKKKKGNTSIFVFLKVSKIPFNMQLTLNFALSPLDRIPTVSVFVQLRYPFIGFALVLSFAGV
jgi:hypothetical protein